MEQNYRRRKRRRRRRAVQIVKRIVCICLLAYIVIFAVSKIYTKMFDGNIHSVFSRQKNIDEVIEQLEEEGYPESLIELARNHPETQEFVVNYMKNRDKHAQIDLSGDVVKGEIPLFLQWDERWGYEQYGGDFLAVTGCGPTCLSMVYCGLTGDTEWNPYAVAKMAEEQGYYVEGSGSSWELMTGGASYIGLIASQVDFSEAGIKSVLESGSPIICVVGPGDFTSTGHFIVLCGVTSEGEIEVRDPNSKSNSGQTWSLETLMSQIKNLWSYTI